MSSMQQQQQIWDKPLFGARRVVKEAEAQLPQQEERVPRERVDLFLTKHPNHYVAQHLRRDALAAAKKKVEYKEALDRVITWEKAILMIDAMEA